MILFIFTFILALFSAMQSFSDGIDRIPDVDEVNYSPDDGEKVETNPPAFIWLPIEGVDTYFIQLSKSADFNESQTNLVEQLDITVYIPTETMQPGQWYWRYGYRKNDIEYHSKHRGFIIPETAVHFPFLPIDSVLKIIPQERPRIFFTPEIVDIVRSDDSGRYAKIIEPVIEQADIILSMNEPLFEEPKAWEEYENINEVYTENWQAMRPYTQRMVISALAYLYTGETKYAEEARRRLMNFMSWDVNGPSSVIWPSELGLDIAEHAPWTFDWIYDYLSEDERRKCIEVLTRRMAQIHYDIHRNRPMETRPFNNHAIRMVGFILESGVVLAHDVTEASKWLDYSLKLIWSSYPAWGKAEGGWHEGVHYWTAYVRRMMRTINELDRIGIPVKDKPFFQNTGYYGLYAAYPHRPTTAPGDEHNTPIESKAGRVMSMLSTMYKNPYFLWHAEQFGIGRLSDGEFNLFDPDVRFPSSMPLELGREAFFVESTDKIEPQSPADLPQSRVFNDVGLVAMHSNMAEPENNVLMLFQSNPFGAISHNHANQNAFMIEAYQQPLAIISGYRYPGNHPHNDEWIKQTKAHNSILVDNMGQLSHDKWSRGRIIGYEEHGDYVFAVGDATQAYEGRLEQFNRYVLFNRPDYFVIIDELKSAGEPSVFQWLLHAIHEMKIDQPNRTVVTTYGDARLTTRFLHPVDLDITQNSGFDSPPPDSESLPEIYHLPRFMPDQYHLTASTTEPASTARFVTVLSTERNTNSHTEAAAGSAEMLVAKGGIGIRVRDDLILWKEDESKQVFAAGASSREIMKVFPRYFEKTQKP